MCIRDRCYAIQVFVRQAGIISGGFTGLAMLAERVGELEGVNVPLQVLLLAFNIPVALLCCKGISVRFTVVSLVQVALTSFFLQVCSFTPIFADEFLNVIFGGVVMGASVVVEMCIRDSSMDAVVALEARLSEVRYELESMTSKLRLLSLIHI